MLDINQLKNLINGEQVRPYSKTENVISIYDNKFLLEIYEFTNSKGEKMYSVFDTFESLLDALKYCQLVRTDNTSYWLNKKYEQVKSHRCKNCYYYNRKECNMHTVDVSQSNKCANFRPITAILLKNYERKLGKQ